MHTDEAAINIHVDEEGDETLNSYITENEILKCIKSLKNNKACSNGRIINENPHADRTTNYMFWAITEAKGEVGSRKTGLRPPSSPIC